MRWEREKVLVREIEGLKGDGGVEERHEEQTDRKRRR